MNRFFEFLKTTVKGGVWFLIPFVVLVIVFEKAQQITFLFVAPVANRIPVHSILGMGFVRVLVVVLLLLVCFFAGLFSKTVLARNLVNWLEKFILTKLTGYQCLQSLGGNFLDLDKDFHHTIRIAQI